MHELHLLMVSTGVPTLSASAWVCRGDPTGKVSNTTSCECKRRGGEEGEGEGRGKGKGKMRGAESGKEGEERRCVGESPQEMRPTPRPVRRGEGGGR